MNKRYCLKLNTYRIFIQKCHCCLLVDEEERSERGLSHQSLWEDCGRAEEGGKSSLFIHHNDNSYIVYRSLELDPF
jgi:hypothetical protein